MPRLLVPSDPATSNKCDTIFDIPSTLEPNKNQTQSFPEKVSYCLHQTFVVFVFRHLQDSNLLCLSRRHFSYILCFSISATIKLSDGIKMEHNSPSRTDTNCAKKFFLDILVAKWVSNTPALPESFKDGTLEDQAVVWTNVYFHTL